MSHRKPVAGRRTTVLAVLFASTMLASAAVAQQRTFAFDRPAEPLADALREYGKTANRQLIFSPDLVRGRQARAVQGRYSADQALTALLDGTDLAWERAPAGGIMIVRRAVAGPPGAAAAASESAEPPRPIDEVIVIGTNIRGNQSSASKVDVIDRQEIVRRGALSVPELLNTIPQNVHSVGAIRTQTANREQIDNVGGATGLNLRGLGANATLTLIDGHRTAPTGIETFFDASAIPIVALERLELLPDGASAVYGSDAVAGVVNYVLRKPTNAIETVLRGASAESSAYNHYNISQLLGRAWAGGGVILAGEYIQNTALKPRNRSFSNRATSPAPLVPPSHTSSLYGKVEQEVGDRLTLNGSLVYSARASSYRDLSNSFTDVSKNLYSGSFGGRYALSESWSLDANASYTRDRTHYVSVSSAGVPFVETINSKGAFANLTASGTLAELPAGGLRGAFGLEAIRTSLLADFGGAKVTDSDTTQRSAFAELAVPLVGPEMGVPFAERVTFSGALRINDFETVGTVTTPKVGLTWEVNDQVTLRGTWGKSFRAPTLYEGSTTGMTSFVRNAADPFSPTGTSRLLFLAGTNPAGLKPERSRNWTIGVDVKPAFAPRLRLSANYFDYHYTDRITAAPATFLQILANPSLYARYLIVNPTVDQVNAFYAASYRVASTAGVPTTPSLITRVVDNRFNNVAETTVRGSDFEASYGFDVGGGQMNASLGGTYFFAFHNVLVPGGPNIKAAGIIYTPSKLRIRADLNYRRDNLFVGLSTDVVGRYVDRVPGQADRSIDVWTPINLRVAYDFPAESRARGTTLAVQVKNLFNVDPPSIRDQNPSGQGPYGYDILNADPLKRVITLEVRRSW